MNCLLWAGFWFLCIATVVIAVEVLIRKTDIHMDERIIGRMWSTGISLVLAFPMLYCLDYALYIWLAPRVYILDWLKEMIK